MKKRRQPPAPQKQKEFKSSPFKELRGFHPEPPPEPVTEVTPPPPPRQEADDADLFLQAMADVRPMSTQKPAPGKTLPREPAVKPVLRRIEEEERRTFLDALEKLQLDVTFRDVTPETEEPHRPLPVNRMRQLRRGTIRIDYELDLHGLTREEALDHLERFIASAVNRHVKAVLVITGRGNHSEGEPVLQKAVTGWLRTEGSGLVAEFASAPRELGGTGAFVVFLKGSPNT